MIQYNKIITVGVLLIFCVVSLYACFNVRDLPMYDDLQQSCGLLLLFALFLNTTGFTQILVTIFILMANAELIDELVNRNEQINGSDYVNLLFAAITLTYLIYNKSRNGRLKRKSG